MHERWRLLPVSSTRGLRKGVSRGVNDLETVSARNYCRRSTESNDFLHFMDVICLQEFLHGIALNRLAVHQTRPIGKNFAGLSIVGFGNARHSETLEQHYGRQRILQGHMFKAASAVI